MSLIKYKQKRHFADTPEPTGGKPGAEKLTFVVQKHAASHLHYDFRLEVKGVLKSWAVPKGPQMDPAVKRLAMQVEDHPYDYKDFEGIIPEGNYGAGTVIIWDEGWYTTFNKKTGEADDQSKTAMEKQLIHDLHAGEVKIVLHGKKLKGKFALIRTRRDDDDSGKNWLLIKDRDEYATEKEIALKDKSVRSGKTLEQMSNDKHAGKWQSNRKATKTPRSKPATRPRATDETKTVAEPKTISLRKTRSSAGAARQKTRSWKLHFEYKGKVHTGAATEAVFGGQRTVTVSLPTNELFHFTWISDDEIFWTDLPVKAKQEMARAIAKQLVK